MVKKKAKEVYHEVWKKYLPLISMKLKQTMRTGDPSHIGMYRFEFHSDGTSKSKGTNHVFMLDVKNGRVMNDISKVEVAQELNSILREESGVETVLRAGHFHFNLDSNFQLTIQKSE